MGKFLRKLAVYTLGFCLLAGVLTYVFYRGSRAVIWSVDAVSQYYPAFLYNGQWLRTILSNFASGNFHVPLYDLSIGMGEDIIGSLNYYGIGDPLNLLTIFATKENGAVLYSAMYLLRLYLAGGALLLYTEYMKLPYRYAVSGAYCYSFFGYSLVAGTMYLQFLSPLIYFPLMILGAEKLIRGQKPYWYLFSVAIGGMCSYYFLYITAIGMAGYAILRLIFVYGKNIRRAAGILFRGILWFAVGIMLSAPFLLPAVSMLSGNARVAESTGLLLLADWRNWVPNLSYLASFLYGMNSNANLDFWRGITLVEMTAVPGIFIACILHRTKRNLQLAIAVAVLSVAYTIPITHYIFSAMAQRYSRWVFLLQFGVVITMVCLFTEFAEAIRRLQPSVGRKRMAAACCLLSAMILCNLGVNICLLFSGYGANYLSEFLDRSSIPGYTDSPLVHSELVQKDAGVYRVANDQLTETNGRPDNVAMINGYHGLNFWWSVVNPGTQAMTRQLGGGDFDGQRSRGLNNSPVYLTNAGVKYYAAKDAYDSPVPIDFAPAEKLEFLGEPWTIYVNENRPEMVRFYQKWAEAEEYSTLPMIDKMTAVMDTVIVPGKGATLLPAATKEQRTGNLVDKADEISVAADGQKVTESEIHFTYVVPEDSEAWVALDDSLPAGVTIRTDRGATDPISLQNQGWHREPVKLVVTAQTEGEAQSDVIRSAIHVYSLSRKKYESIMSQSNVAAAAKVTSFTARKDQFTLSTVNGKNTIAVTAIPYTKDWKVYVDGERTESFPANTMYLGFVLPEGEHEIILRYEPLAIRIGVILFIAGMAITVLVGFRDRKQGQGQHMEIHAS
ncbi:Uncharacterized membrane protein YfhO [Lachnospiraceae bacterium NK3A20]|nr:Uncharacterized membrane protein YfhO [Lachnospiraceae bacterium NK3A20]